jgi:hypothetical protein
METSTPPHQALDLSTPLYYQLVYTLTDLLPPPLDDTPEALHARNHAAIAKIAALLPVNANEADLAAQCIAARAQGEDLLRLLRQNAGDIGLVMRLNAQYGSMVRTSLSVHGRLMRVQALRHKREAIGAAVNADAWAQHVAERSMLAVVDSDAGPLEAAPEATRIEPPPKVAPVTPPVEAPPEAIRAEAPPKVAPIATSVEAPAASPDQSTPENVSETALHSQHAALETWLSQQPWNQGSKRSGDTDLRNVVREAVAKSRLANARPAGQIFPASGDESPRKADYSCHID